MPRPGCGGALQGLGWFSASAVAADAPRLVALWWDVNQEVNAAEHSDFVEAADSSIVLDASARDDAVLATPHGQVTLELVSLCYFSGNHYITVCRDSRVTPPWVCWDALNTSGQCWALDAAPTGSNLLRSSNGEHTWSARYRPTLAIYRRKTGVGDGPT